MERWGERSGRSPLLPPTPPLSRALKPASIAGLHRPNRSSSHTFSSQIYLEEVSEILAVVDDFRKAPFPSPRAEEVTKRSALGFFQQPVPLRPDRSLRAVADPEPLEGAAQMSLDRLLTDPETPGDLLVGQPSGHQS
jgi:hypothetical protein